MSPFVFLSVNESQWIFLLKGGKGRNHYRNTTTTITAGFGCVAKGINRKSKVWR